MNETTESAEPYFEGATTVIRMEEYPPGSGLYREEPVSAIERKLDRIIQLLEKIAGTTPAS